MYRSLTLPVAVFVVAAFAVIAAQPKPAGDQRINLAEYLAAGKLKSSNRTVTKLPERNGVHVDDAKPESSIVIWIDGSDFRTGTLEVDVRGRDVVGQSFLGLAFHGRDEKTYEAVYVRPFNFRTDDPARKQHAVQYMSLPDFDWGRLRKEFPEEFENPVDASLVPTDWVRLRLVVRERDVQVYAGQVKTPTLEVRKLGQLEGGMVGLWVGSYQGDYANLVITPAK
jgi:hypothetical protein